MSLDSDSVPARPAPASPSPGCPSTQPHVLLGGCSDPNLSTPGSKPFYTSGCWVGGPSPHLCHFAPLLGPAEGA